MRSVESRARVSVAAQAQRLRRGRRAHQPRHLEVDPARRGGACGTAREAQGGPHAPASGAPHERLLQRLGRRVERCAGLLLRLLRRVVVVVAVVVGPAKRSAAERSLRLGCLSGSISRLRVAGTHAAASPPAPAAPPPFFTLFAFFFALRLAAALAPLRCGAASSSSSSRAANAFASVGAIGQALQAERC